MRDYVIVGTTSPDGDLVKGELLLLGVNDYDPMTPARIYNPSLPGSLSKVAPATQHTRFNLWHDYTGPQDALALALPERIFSDAEGGT